MKEVGMKEFPGCTIASFRDKASGTFHLASNSDNPWSARTNVIVGRGEFYRYLGTKLNCHDEALPWNNMITRGVNEKGLCFTFSYVDVASDEYSSDEDSNPFRRFGTEILGVCDTVDQVHRKLENYGSLPCGNFLFSDREGGFFGCELSPGIRRIWDMGPGPVVRTNHYVECPRGDTTYVEESQSKSRWAEANETLKRKCARGMGETSADLVLGEIMSSHFSPNGKPGGSPCNHGDRFGTVSSERLDPVTGTLSYCFGPLCGRGRVKGSWGKMVNFKLSQFPETFLGEVTSASGKILHKP